MPEFFDWTPERVQFLREHYKTLGRAEIARRWGVKPICIGRKAHRMGITEPAADRNPVRFDWTPERLAALKAGYAEHGGHYFAELWGMTDAAVHQRAYRMGLSDRSNIGRPGKTKRFPSKPNPAQYLVGKRGDALEIVETVAKRKSPRRQCAWRDVGNRFLGKGKPCGNPAEPGSMWCGCCQRKVDALRRAA